MSTFLTHHHQHEPAFVTMIGEGKSLGVPRVRTSDALSSFDTARILRHLLELGHIVQIV